MCRKIVEDRVSLWRGGGKRKRSEGDDAQLSSTSNVNVVPDLASQPVSCDGSGPTLVKRPGQTVKVPARERGGVSRSLHSTSGKSSKETARRTLIRHGNLAILLGLRVDHDQDRPQCDEKVKAGHVEARRRF